MVEEPEGLAAFAALLQVHAAVVRKLEERLEEHRLVPIAQYDVLLELNAAPGRRLRMQQLSDRVVLSRSRVSRVVDEMEQAALVRREPDPDDRRAAFAVITDDGRVAVGEHRSDGGLVAVVREVLRSGDVRVLVVLRGQRLNDDRSAGVEDGADAVAVDRARVGSGFGHGGASWVGSG